MLVHEEAHYRICRITVPTFTLVEWVHCYVYEDQTGVFLIDAGMKDEDSWNKYQQAMKIHGFSPDRVKGILITHHHSDHTSGLERVVNTYNAPVYADPRAIKRINDWTAFQRRRLDFLSVYYAEAGCGVYGNTYIAAARNRLDQNASASHQFQINAVQDNAVIGPFTVIETPGHSPDHLFFVHESERFAFTGDLILQDKSTNALIEPDDSGDRMKTVDQYRESLLKTKRLNLPRLYPGHGDIITDQSRVVHEKLDRINYKVTKLLSILEEGALTPFDIAMRVYPDRYQTIFHLIMSDILGFLDYMEHKGLIDKYLDGGVWYYHLTGNEL